MALIHPTAIIEAGAQLADDVEVGAYSIIGGQVKIGAGTRIAAHVQIKGDTQIGVGNQIFSFCSIGEIPQDKKYKGEPTRLVIGDYNTIRESCTFNLGTVQENGITQVGSHNWIMAYVHIAHDCVVGDYVTIANCTQLAGHVKIDNYVTLGGFTGIHQYCRVGAYCMTAVGTVLLQDLPPYVMAGGNPCAPHGINSEGLKRRGFSADSITEIRRAYKTLYRQGLTLAEAREQIASQIAHTPELARLHDFISQQGRGIVR